MKGSGNPNHMSLRRIGPPRPRGGIGRRVLLAQGAALLAFHRPGALAANAEPDIRRGDLTIGFASGAMHLLQVPQPTTVEIVMELESPADAIRIGVANSTPNPFRLDGVSLTEATGEAAYAPLADSEWKPLSFGAHGGHGRRVVVPGNTPTPEGATNVPAIIWSDWLPYRTQTAGRPLIMLRCLVPPQAIPMAFVAWPDRNDERLPGIPPRVRGAFDLPGDFLASPGPAPVPAKRTQHAPIYALQYRSVTKGIQIVVGGDSQMAVWHEFAQLAAMQLSTPAKPVATWNVAWAAQPSKTFWPLQELAIDAAHPSFVVIQGWTAADGASPEEWAHYLDLIHRSIDHARRLGAIPIIYKGPPRALFGNPMLPRWQAFNRNLDKAFPGVAILDPNPVVEDPHAPGNWRPEDSADTIHPSPKGDLAMLPLFEQIIKPLL